MIPSGALKFSKPPNGTNSSALRAYPTVTAEAAGPLRGILCSIPEKTSQECATLKDFKGVLTAVFFQECAVPLPCGSIFLPLSCLFISSSRLELKVQGFDGCVGYAQPIHTQFRPASIQTVLMEGEVHRQSWGSKPRMRFRAEVMEGFDRLARSQIGQT